MSNFTIKLTHLLQKIRTLCKECSLTPLPAKVSPQEGPKLQPAMDQYLKCLDELRVRFYEFHETSEQYKKLEEVLQKNETEIRKHIGIQQQLKLYIDTIKSQFEDSENDRLELLQNSKAMIKSLKSENERLFTQLKQKEVQISKGKQSLKKIHSRHERVKTDHFLSVYQNEHRTFTDQGIKSPSRKKKIGADFKIELTERPQGSHKKKMFELRKKYGQSHTILAYSNFPQKKRNSKERQTMKKPLVSYSDSKKIGSTSVLKQNYEKSNKKVNRSVFSLPDDQADKDLSDHKIMKGQDLKNKDICPNAFYFSPDVLRKMK